MSLNENNTLGEWATTYAGAVAIFLKHNLDFCCGGKEPLKNACVRKSLNTDDLIKKIIDESNGKPVPNWNTLPLSKIIETILDNFHAKHRQDFQMLIPLAKKVERVHHDHPDCPTGLGSFLMQLYNELEMHMQKEEQILFPMINNGQGHMATAPIEVMMRDHLWHGEALEKLQSLAKNYNLPDGACGSWRALYQGVANLEKEIKEHISTENNILFPKASA